MLYIITGRNKPILIDIAQDKSYSIRHIDFGVHNDLYQICLLNVIGDDQWCLNGFEIFNIVRIINRELTIINRPEGR